VKSFEDEHLVKRAERSVTRSRASQGTHEAEALTPGTSPGPGRPLGAGQVLALQRQAGNAAVVQLLADDEEESQESPVHDIVGKGGGTPLPNASRTKMEASFGQDFSQVRIHTDNRAAASARSVNAQAYTVGNDIVFGANSPSLNSDTGQHGLAHELAHVVQQRSGPVDGTPAPGGIQISDPSDRFETQAEQIADRVEAGQSQLPGAEAGLAGSGFSMQRQEEGEEEEAEE
jgi:Domain of unknown function (DUF4157)